ncbi:MAG: protease complex subunit PrcB family protein [Thioalkalispiraceae bacterium]|jgi:hypothetical protein
MTGCTTTSEPAPIGTNKNILFRTIAQGQSSGLTREKFLTFRSIIDFAEFWNVHSRGNLASIPKINFETQMVLAVFMGEKRTGGYAIRVEKIIEQEKRLRVGILVITPDADSARTMMISQPYHIVVLPKINKPVEYSFRTNQ